MSILKEGGGVFLASLGNGGAPARAVILTLLFAIAASATWERRVGTESGEWTDAPSSHDLKYFEASACADHAPKDRLSECDKTRTKLQLVGSAGQYTIYDLTYYPDDGETRSDVVVAKSTLVMSAPNVFREIYFRNVEFGDAAVPTKIVSIGSERILWETYHYGGIYHLFAEDFFSFGDEGPKLMHPESIFKAAGAKVPRDSVIWGPTGAFDFEAKVWTAGTELSNPNIGPKVACCIGRVTVHFKIEKGEFFSLRVEYDPKWDYQRGGQNPADLR